MNNSSCEIQISDPLQVEKENKKKHLTYQIVKTGMNLPQFHVHPSNLTFFIDPSEPKRLKRKNTSICA
jgi:hypothetical protein